MHNNLKTNSTNNLKIKGKDKEISTTYIQKHLPECNMKLLITETGNMLLCQENHPIIVESPFEKTVIEAKNAILDFHKLWVDNEELFKEEINVDLDYYMLAEHIYSGVKLNTPYTTCNGNKIRFNSDCIKYNKTWIKNFIDSLIKIFNNKVVSINNYYLTQQIKHFCDKIGYDFKLLLAYETNTQTDFIIHITKNNKDKKFCGYSKIKDEFTLLNWKEYVYDIKTETEEFMLDFVQTHNSFHSGGSVESVKVDILSEMIGRISDDNKKYLEMMVLQKNEELYCTTNEIVIEFDIDVFNNTEKYKIIDKNDSYILPFGYFDFKSGGLNFSANIEQETIIYKNDSLIIDNGNNVRLTYKKGDKMLMVKRKIVAPEKVAQYIDELIGGSSPFTDPVSLYWKFYKSLATFGNWDSVHLEVILSAILRNSKNPQIPARLVEPYEFKTFSIKTLPGIISWSMGLAYENFGKALATGLTSERMQESGIEKVLFGEPLSELSKEKLKERRRKNR